MEWRVVAAVAGIVALGLVIVVPIAYEIGVSPPSPASEQEAREVMKRLGHTALPWPEAMTSIGKWTWCSQSDSDEPGICLKVWDTSLGVKYSGHTDQEYAGLSSEWPAGFERRSFGERELNDLPEVKVPAGPDDEPLDYERCTTWVC